MEPSNLTLTKPLQVVIWSSVAVETRCMGGSLVLVDGGALVFYRYDWMGACIESWWGG